MLSSELTNKFFETNLSGKKFPLFVCSRDLSRGKLKEFFTINSSNVKRICNYREIAQDIKDIHSELKFSKPFAKLKDSLNEITGIGLSAAGYGFSITTAGTNRQPSHNSNASKQIIYIEQDNLNPLQLNQLASLYKDLPSIRRPLMFFEPHENDTIFLKELDTLNTDIELKTLGQVNKWFINSTKKRKNKITSVEDFVNYFLSNSHKSCYHAKSILLSEKDFSKNSPSSILKKLSLEALTIKSADYNGDKFEGRIRAIQLISKIKKAMDFMESRKMVECLLSLKGIVNLWLAYIDESYRDGIDNCLAIAKELDNKHLEAHCFRVMNIKTRGGAMADYFVSKAVDYFFTMADHENYVYSKNNQLLNKMSFDGIELEAFSELVDFSLEETKYIDRLSTIVNNAGTANLIAGSLDLAMDFYEKATNLSGQPIHRVGIELNKLIVRYMAGEHLDPEFILQIFRKMIRENIPKGFDYHQSYICWNLIKLSDFNSYVKEEIFGYLEKEKFMSYSSVLEEKESMIDFLSKSRILNLSKGRFPGPRGKFIHRTDLYPIVHYSWM